MMQVSWLPLSLESPINDEDDSELGMFVEDEVTPTPMQSAYTNLLREKIEEVLSTLPPRERASFGCVLAWITDEPIRWKKWAKSSV
jgi:DNA-directed RNA polymerase sigma subunit (sigma70/sigma32)